MLIHSMDLNVVTNDSYNNISTQKKKKVKSRFPVPLRFSEAPKVFDLQNGDK